MAEVTLYITIDPIPITSIEFKNENYRKWKRSNSVSCVYDFGAILIIHLADWHPLEYFWLGLPSTLGRIVNKTKMPLHWLAW